MFEAVRMRGTRTSPAEKHNRKGKRSQTVYAPMLRIFMLYSELWARNAYGCKTRNV